MSDMLCKYTNTFVSSCPISCAPFPDIGQLTVCHTKLVQYYPAVQGHRGHRGPEDDLGEEVSPQGTEAEIDTGTSPQHLILDCEPGSRQPNSSLTCMASN